MSGRWHRLDETIHVVSRACPLLVPLVENGRYQPGDAVIETVAREYLEPLRQEGLDVLILGCTHYPLLTDIIREIMGPEVSLVNAGAESVHTLHDALARRQLLAPEGTGQALLCTSDRPEGFGQMAAASCRRSLRLPCGWWTSSDTEEAVMEGNVKGPCGEPHPAPGHGGCAALPGQRYAGAHPVGVAAAVSGPQR